MTCLLVLVAWTLLSIAAAFGLAAVLKQRQIYVESDEDDY